MKKILLKMRTNADIGYFLSFFNIPVKYRNILQLFHRIRFYKKLDLE